MDCVFKENKIKHVDSFCVLIPTIDVTEWVDFRSGQGSTAAVKPKVGFSRPETQSPSPGGCFSLRSCGLNRHHRQAGAFPLCRDPGLTGNYSSASLIAMEIDFLHRAKSTQALGCMPCRSGPVNGTPPPDWGLWACTAEVGPPSGWRTAFSGLYVLESDCISGVCLRSL